VCIPSQARLADQHLEQDERWSHAKLYLLRSRRKRYLLVTSANWSIAAWGAGKTPPRNFELGVLFESEWASLETLGEPFAPPELAPYCTDRVDDEPAPSSLEWAEATWDGREIVLSVRSSRQDIPVSATVHFLGAEPAETGLTDGAARIPWSDALQPPSRASFRQGHARLEVAVLDLRAPDAFEQTPLPEVDPAVMQAVKDAFLLQRYGGPAVEPEFIPGLSATPSPPTTRWKHGPMLDRRLRLLIVGGRSCARPQRIQHAVASSSATEPNSKTRSGDKAPKAQNWPPKSSRGGWRTNHERRPPARCSQVEVPR